jgi:Leucine-rich repeat (LRR) protein
MSDEKDAPLSLDEGRVNSFASVDWSRIDALFDEQSKSLAALARAAGQEPQSFFVGRDFTGLSLRRMDIRGVNLSRARLEGARLREARLDASTKLDGATFDREDRRALIGMGLLKGDRPPKGFSDAAVKRMILAGQSPPPTWRPWIESLDLLGEPRLRDIAPLATLPALRDLNLAYTSVRDLSSLAGLAGLRRLWLNATQVRDLGPLAGLSALQQLWLDNTPVSDLTPLAGLNALRHLWLDNTRVSDLTPLAGLAGLHALFLDDTQVSDLAPLARLTSLETLYIKKTPIRNLAPLARLPKLGRVFVESEARRDALSRTSGHRLNIFVVSDRLP